MPVKGKKKNLSKETEIAFSLSCYFLIFNDLGSFIFPCSNIYGFFSWSLWKEKYTRDSWGPHVVHKRKAWPWCGSQNTHRNPSEHLGISSKTRMPLSCTASYFPETHLGCGLPWDIHCSHTPNAVFLSSMPLNLLVSMAGTPFSSLSILKSLLSKKLY